MGIPAIFSISAKDSETNCHFGCPHTPKARKTYLFSYVRKRWAFRFRHGFRDRRRSRRDERSLFCRDNRDFCRSYILPCFGQYFFFPPFQHTELFFGVEPMFAPVCDRQTAVFVFRESRDFRTRNNRVVFSVKYMRVSPDGMHTFFTRIAKIPPRKFRAERSDNILFPFAVALPTRSPRPSLKESFAPYSEAAK